MSISTLSPYNLSLTRLKTSTHYFLLANSGQTERSWHQFSFHAIKLSQYHSRLYWCDCLLGSLYTTDGWNSSSDKGFVGNLIFLLRNVGQWFMMNVFSCALNNILKLFKLWSHFVMHDLKQFEITEYICVAHLQRYNIHIAYTDFEIFL